MRKIVFSLLLFSLISIFACKPGDEDKPQKKPTELPQAEPHASRMPTTETAKGKEIVRAKSVIEVPEEIQAAWSSVKIEVYYDDTNEKVESFELKRNEELAIKGTVLKVRIADFIPHFTMGEGVITSIDSEPTNPAIHMVVSDDVEEIWNAVAFRNHPKYHTFEYENIKIIFKDFIPAKSNTGTD